MTYISKTVKNCEQKHHPFDIAVAIVFAGHEQHTSVCQHVSVSAAVVFVVATLSSIFASWFGFECRVAVPFIRLCLST